MPTTAAGATSAAAVSESEIKNVAKRFSNLWTIYFRHGMNATLSKNFSHDGDLQSAIKRAQHHCLIMGYRYIFVRPLICDIEEEEQYKLKGGVPETSPGV